MRITKSELNAYKAMFAHYGGNLTNLDESAGIATVVFDDIVDLDSFIKRVQSSDVAWAADSFETAMLDGRGILTITTH